jgi:hypothetical protein
MARNHKQIKPNNMKEIKITWTTDDVFMMADELGVELGEHEADEILEQLYDNHDASIGICWDVIDSYIHQYQEEREEQKTQTK